MSIKKRSRLEKMIPTILSVGALALMVSCAGDTGDGSSEAPQQQQQEDEGVYSASLTTLNSSVAGASAGTAKIAVVGDKMAVTIQMNGVPVRISHLQHIHSGSACPTAAADTNADGFVDVVEGVPSYGPILIPLDGDLRSQAGGMNSSPVASSTGTYTYFRTVSITDMLTDLRAPDTDDADAVAKLAPGEELNLAGRHIVIHGVPASTTLPATVQSIKDIPAQATLPIACGVIERETVSTETTGTTGT